MVSRLVSYFVQEAFDLNLLLHRQWKQRLAWISAVIPVEVARILHSGDSHLSNDSLIRLDEALLPLCRQFRIAILPCEVNLVACLWSTCAESQNRSRPPGLE